ncbi:MAG: efflux RND transporter periplasmic adaptor subunit [Chlamydiota bacterium]
MIKRFITLSTIICVLYSCTTVEESQKPQKVRYTKVVSSSGVQPRSFSGQTKASIESKLSFRVPGIIQKLPVNVGDEVNKGAMIAKLDGTDYILKVQEAEAALLQAIAQERQATADYKRMRDLYESKSASKAELDAARAQAESTTASADAAEKKLQLTKSQLTYATLKAPIDGSIATVDVEVNENVATGQTVVTLNSRAQLEVNVAIPELLITQVSKGDPSQVTFDALPGEYYEAVVTEVGIASDVGTTYPVTVRLIDTPEGMRSGMAAEVIFKFRVSDSDETIYVPSQSVLGNEDAQRYVFLLLMGEDNNGVVQKKMVTIGQITNEGIEITSGLKPGDLIVTAGVQFLTDGQGVQVVY